MLVPSRDHFIANARQGDLIPVYREILADRLTPVSAFEKLQGGAGSFLLESVEGGERLARYSFLGSQPFLTFRAVGSRISVEDASGSRPIPAADGGDALSVLGSLLSGFRFVETPGLPRFCGGAVGYVAYDMARQIERLPEIAPDDLGLPDCVFYLTDTLLIFDHVRHRIMVLSNARVGEQPAEDYDRAASAIDALVARLRGPGNLTEANPAQGAGPAPEPSVPQAEFERWVRRCKEYIAAGDVFQVVPSVRFRAELRATPFEVYRALRFLNPSPYMYYLDLGDAQVVGSSPEILATVEDGKVSVRPIAGTRRRGATPAEDLLLEQELLADEKERAEHIMLVDLGRNDVGRVAEYGTVRVDELMVIERYSHVMHIVSHVSGRMAEGKDVFDAFRACFPAGTLTGAPKIRAMQIIEELEPSRRGLYGGAVGYFSYSGDMDFAIAIRTMLVRGGTAYVQAGAGVVADSSPEMEHSEVANKARALFAALGMAEAGLD